MRTPHASAVRKMLCAAALFLAGLGTACMGPAGHGSFDRTLEITGPVHLYLTNGSGAARIVAGPSGQVHIHADFHVRLWFWGNPQSRIADLTAKPPIYQQGNFIRVGLERYHSGNITIDYTIEAPPQSEVRATDGSGNLAIGGLEGPVDATTGSGDVHLNQIQGDARATTGSGNVRVEAVRGSAEITAGSGDVVLSSVGGRLRVTTGSGDITLTSPGNSVTLRNGSGDIRVSGASSDLTIHTGSGDLAVSGSPSSGAYWELHTGSGDVDLSVPGSASFRFFAQTRMGDIRSNLPMTVLERQSRQLRGVVGQGAARVEVEAGSGDIRLNSSNR